MKMVDNNQNDTLEVIDYRTLEMTDEHGTEWAEVNYTYECPKDNYLDGEEVEVINATYRGPAELYLWVRKDEEKRGQIEAVIRKWEAMDGRPTPGDIEVVVLDATKWPLECEVLSDYHDNYKDLPEYQETPGTKKLQGVPEGYVAFEWEYPIHPDHLFDNRKSTYNFDTQRVELYRNKNVDIIGEAPTWDDVKRIRDERLASTDTLWLVLKDIDPERWAKIDKYRQALRDMPEALKDIPMIFVDSCFPMTDALR